MAKRILILIKGLGRGGAEQLLVNAAPYLDRERFDYEVAYLLPWKDALVGELESTGLTVHCLGGGKGVAWMRRLRRLVKERHIDLVHTHSPVLAVAVRTMLHKNRPHRVYTEHNVWERFHPATYWANLLTFPLSDHVFAVSDHVRHSIRYPRALRFLPNPPVETLYHGPDPAAVAVWQTDDGVRDELGIPSDAPIVGTVANFKEHKGYPFLMKAASLVKEKIPEVRFVLIGLGPLEEQIRRQAKQLGLNGTVVFAGFREDVPRIAAEFDVFALASLHEGLSIALIEAMALSKPAVVTSVGGLPEAVTHREHGFVVPPRDPEALAAGLVTLLQDPALRDRMGRNARARANDFDIRSAVARMQDVYAELLS